MEIIGVGYSSVKESMGEILERWSDGVLMRAD